MMLTGEGVIGEVRAERAKQDDKWGEQNHPDGLIGRPVDVAEAAQAKARCQANGPDQDNWRDILDEEITEAYAAQTQDELRAELIQVAAVAAAWVQTIDRRAARAVQQAGAQ